MLSLYPSRLERLTEYLADQAGAFRRRDQVRWAALYLLGLIEAQGRRNIESLARAVANTGLVVREDLAQGLGHFLSHSPWDENTLWRRSAERLAGREGVFVLEEMPLLKQGRHSVGVHRQYSRALGHKANCQIAVALYHVGESAVLVGLRLYLPRAWLRDEARLDAAGVPNYHRDSIDRLGIALELLTAARQAGLASREVAAGRGWVWGEQAEPLLHARGLEVVARSAHLEAEWATTRNRLEQFGLGHFEGRSWRGFHHHACLVAQAEVAERLLQHRDE